MSTDSGYLVSVEASNTLPTPGAPLTLVEQRFAETLTLVNQMKELLMGADGSGGYLGYLVELISSVPSSDIVAPTVDTALNFRTLPSVPTFDDSKLKDIPFTEYDVPVMRPLPSVDTGILEPGVSPTEVSPTLLWSESSAVDDIYSAMLSRVLNDLQAGVTGIPEDIEVALIARAKARQTLTNTTAYAKLNLDIASRGFQNPEAGPVVSALTEFNAEMLRQETDSNNTLTIAAYEAAQKNNAFIVQASLELEKLIRATKDSRDKNAFEAAKTQATLILQDYSERVKAFVAEQEAKKLYVEALATNIDAVTKANISDIEVFKAEYVALETRISATTKYNTGLTDVYSARMQGFTEDARALQAEVSAKAEELKARVTAADFQLRALIAEADNELKGYEVQTNAKTQVGKSLAEIGAQVMASALNAVNATASMGYTGSESKNESWSHSDSLQESHSYPHDPAN